VCGGFDASGVVAADFDADRDANLLAKVACRRCRLSVVGFEVEVAAVVHRTPADVTARLDE
jgi:hypothetical protein